MHTINSILCYLLKIRLEMVTSGDITRAIAKTLGKNYISVLNQRCHAFGSKEKLPKLNGSQSEITRAYIVTNILFLN